MFSSDVRSESVLIGNRDHRRLRRYVAAWEAKLSRDAEHLAKVRARLRSCVEVLGDSVPATLVTIGSQVRVGDVVSGKSFVWTVVLPPDEEVALTARSPLSWSGATLIGAREGDEVLLESPAGPRRVRIEAVLFQPEAAQRQPKARSTTRSKGKTARLQPRASVPIARSARTRPQKVHAARAARSPSKHAMPSTDNP